jgi:5'-3' exonuclease
MGIKNLHRFLRRHSPSAYADVPLSSLQNKKVAIDINVYLFKFKSIHRDKWLTSFINFICKLLYYNIQCVCVYDTKSPPEKNARKEERKSRKQQIKNKITDIELALKTYEDTGIVAPILCEKQQCHPLLQIENRAPKVNRQEVEENLERLKRQVVNVLRSDISITKEFLSLMGIVYFDSDTEAETMCAHLCCNGIVDAVLSDDTDVLVYGTPIFVTKFNFTKETCVMVHYPTILSNLLLTRDQFVDFCILSGTDYNDNIPQIGNEKAYKLLQKYGTIENIPEIDTACLNYNRVRDIFKVPPEIDSAIIETIHQFNQPKLNKEQLALFAFKYNTTIPFKTIKNHT